MALAVSDRVRLRPGRRGTIDVWTVELSDGEPSELGREQRLAARAGVSGLVADLTGADPLSVRLEHDRRGRPVLPDHPELNVSISHSGRFIVCAVARVELGVDVEPGDRPEADEHLARRICTRGERQWLESLGLEIHQAALVWLWIRKEALAKALGIGLSLRMTSVDVRRDTPVFEGVPAQDWALRDLPASGGYLAALATRGRCRKVRSRRVAASALAGAQILSSSQPR